MKFRIKTILAERSNIERTEKTGECYISGDYKHFYLVRDNDVLHVTEGCINTLYDNSLTSSREDFDDTYVKIKREEFNEALNKVVFELDYFGSDYRSM